MDLLDIRGLIFEACDFKSKLNLKRTSRSFRSIYQNWVRKATILDRSFINMAVMTSKDEIFVDSYIDCYEEGADAYQSISGTSRIHINARAIPKICGIPLFSMAYGYVSAVGHVNAPAWRDLYAFDESKPLCVDNMTLYIYAREGSLSGMPFRVSGNKLEAGGSYAFTFVVRADWIPPNSDRGLEFDNPLDAYILFMTEATRRSLHINEDWHRPSIVANLQMAKFGIPYGGYIWGTRLSGGIHACPFSRPAKSYDIARAFVFWSRKDKTVTYTHGHLDTITGTYVNGIIHFVSLSKLAEPSYVLNVSVSPTLIWVPELKVHAASELCKDLVMCDEGCDYGQVHRSVKVIDSNRVSFRAIVLYTRGMDPDIKKIHTWNWLTRRAPERALEEVD